MFYDHCLKFDAQFQILFFVCFYGARAYLQGEINDPALYDLYLIESPHDESETPEHAFHLFLSLFTSSFNHNENTIIYHRQTTGNDT